MSNTLFITDSDNQEKLTAIKRAAQKAGFESTIKISPIEIEDYIPYTEDETIFHARKRLDLISAANKENDIDVEHKLFVSIQKGIVFNAKDNQLKLICRAWVQKEESSWCGESSSIFLPPRINALIIRKAMPLYNAYEEVFGNIITSETICKILTGIPESAWMAEAVFQALVPHSERARRWF